MQWEEKWEPWRLSVLILTVHGKESSNSMKYVPGSAYAIKLCHLEHQFRLVPLVVEVIYFSLFLLYFNLNILNP